MQDYQKKSSFKLLCHFVCQYPWQSMLVVVSLVMAGLAETLGVGALLPLLNIVLEASPESVEDPSMLHNFINQVLGFLGIEQTFNNLLLLIVLMISAKAVIIFFSLIIVSYISADITYDLRRNLIKSLMYARWDYFSDLNIGSSSNAIATESDYAGQFCMIMGKAITAALQVCVYGLIALSVDWKISLAAIFMGGIMAFVLKTLVRMARDAGTDMANASNTLLSRLNAYLSGAKPIKAMGEEGYYVDVLQNDTKLFQNARKRLAYASLLLNNIHEPMLVTLMALGLYWAYGYANYPMGELFIMAFLFNRLLSQVNMVQNHYQKSSVFEAAVNGILEKTHIAESYKEIDGGSIEPTLKKEIGLKNLSLSYGDLKVLNNLNANIPAGKMTALFGPSGSGKSTVLNLILGLSEPHEGNIIIDGTSLTDISLNKWRAMIGYVPQETFLFHDTILNNISLGDKKYSEDDVVAALKLSNAWEFVQEMPDGLQHIVGERGAKLSGGQRQRLALARALVRSPRLLILDEATSGLDEKNENEIIESIKNLNTCVTTIIISHNPKIKKCVDHVITLG